MDMQQVVNLLGAVALCELLLELFYEARPLAPLRRLFRIEDKLGYPITCGDDEAGAGCAWYSLLAGCGYCLSVWVGVFCAVIFGLRLFAAPWMPAAFVWVLNGLIVHRLSNVWHAVVHRLIDTEGRLRRRLSMFGGADAAQAASPAGAPDNEPADAARGL
jgi:hypothetical protein